MLDQVEYEEHYRGYGSKTFEQQEQGKRKGKVITSSINVLIHSIVINIVQ